MTRLWAYATRAQPNVWVWFGPLCVCVGGRAEGHGLRVWVGALQRVGPVPGQARAPVSVCVVCFCRFLEGVCVTWRVGRVLASLYAE